MYESIVVTGTMLVLSLLLLHLYDENYTLKETLFQQRAEVKKLQEQVQIQHARQGLLFHGEKIEGEEAESFSLLCEAIEQQKEVRFSYKGRKTQIIQPYMLKKYNDWCVIGDSSNKGLIRTFKIKNMEELTIL